MYFIFYISFIILQRLSELRLSAKNEKWLLAHGAVQYGQKHYPYIVVLHTLFIISIIAEYLFRENTSIDFIFLGIYLALIIFKYWALTSLGPYWNTKIYRIPNFSPVVKGPYKYFKHPNYFEVVCEIAVIPMVFHLYYTAVIFTILNGIMLYVRISEENRTWKKA